MGCVKCRTLFDELLSAMTEVVALQRDLAGGARTGLPTSDVCVQRAQDATKAWIDVIQNHAHRLAHHRLN
jgi:hypothetical protein